MIAALTLLAVTSSATADIPRKFDLECRGAKKYSSSKDHPDEAWHNSYSIDLDRGAWCDRSNCRTYKIDSVYANGISLRGDPPPLDLPSLAKVIIFSPKSMIIDLQNWEGAKTNFVKATCQYAAFEPLPAGEPVTPQRGVD